MTNCDISLKKRGKVVTSRFNRISNLFSYGNLTSKHKKGQVTTFIIIGLLLLLLVVLLFYMNSKFNFVNKVGDQETFQAKDPVSAFVQQCLQQVSDEALEKIGQEFKLGG